MRGNEAAWRKRLSSPQCAPRPRPQLDDGFGWVRYWNGGNAASQALNLNINTEPPSLIPTLATDTTSGTVLTHVMEGLTRYGEGGKTIPGIAESWDVSDDGMKYVFHLRDAKWSDGQPVTAHDFEYAWKKLLIRIRQLIMPTSCFT